jgi:hypothetical protein
LIRQRLDEANEAGKHLHSIISGLPEGQLPSTQFLGETMRMLIELQNFEAALDIAGISLSIDEHQPDALYIQAFAQFKLQQHDDSKESLILLRAKFQTLPEELSVALGELEQQVHRA